ncbi:MAG: outer-membrane lipoprotein carrier protein LolA [Pseudomonadota bacterium]
MPFQLAGVIASAALVAAPLFLQVSGAETEPSERAAEPIEDVITVPTARVGLTPLEREEIVAQASAALGDVRTARGRFLQTAPDWSQTTGDFALRRPGRVRFEYDAPTPIRIVADGATVAIEDRDLETQDRAPLGATPLALILDDDIDFEREAEILDVERTDAYAAMTIQDRSGEVDGQLTLFFSRDGYDLLGWRTVDGAGGVTLVELSDVETGVRINPRTFRIEDPEDSDDRRR